MLSAILCIALASPAAATQTLDEDVNVSVGQVDFEPRPIRARRPLTLGAEIGWNGLGGTGLQVSYDVHPHFSIDTGLGIAATGIKVGVRGRYNFMLSKLTPFVGIGGAYGTGSFGSKEVVMNGATNTIAVGASPFAQAVAGASYVASNGFALQASLGYSLLLMDNNVAIQGPVSRDVNKNALYGSGPIASVMLGYAL